MFARGVGGGVQIQCACEKLGGSWQTGEPQCVVLGGSPGGRWGSGKFVPILGGMSPL